MAPRTLIYRMQQYRYDYQSRVISVLVEHGYNDTQGAFVRLGGEEFSISPQELQQWIASNYPAQVSPLTEHFQYFRSDVTAVLRAWAKSMGALDE